jgi:hypothetical protein
VRFEWRAGRDQALWRDGENTGEVLALASSKDRGGTTMVGTPRAGSRAQFELGDDGRSRRAWIFQGTTCGRREVGKKKLDTMEMGRAALLGAFGFRRSSKT